MEDTDRSDAESAAEVAESHCGGSPRRPHGVDGFSTAADLWLEKMDAMVADGRRSPGTVETYRRQLKNHVLPAMGEIRLGEATTPLVDKVVAKIKTDVSAATAKSCRSVISGVLGLAVRYGAIMVNPVRDIERIESKPKKAPGR